MLMKACGDKGQQTEVEARQHQGGGRKKKPTGKGSADTKKKKRRPAKP